jgi:hypothetical protein
MVLEGKNHAQGKLDMKVEIDVVVCATYFDD